MREALYQSEIVRSSSFRSFFVFSLFDKNVPKRLRGDREKSQPHFFCNILSSPLPTVEVSEDGGKEEFVELKRFGELLQQLEDTVDKLHRTHKVRDREKE